VIVKVSSATLLGLEAIPITVEVDTAQGLPQETIVGLPDTVVKESKKRIKAALKNSGFDYPLNVYTINLSPSHLKKEGAFLELAIATGILQATKQLPPFKNPTLLLGSVSLDGSIEPIKGILSLCHPLLESHPDTTIIVPKENIPDLHVLASSRIIGISRLKELSQVPKAIPIPTQNHKPKPYNVDFGDVKGQYTAKRVLEIAMAGGHNCLFIGPPGSGKTMLMKRLHTILPQLTKAQAIATFKIHEQHGNSQRNQSSFFSPPIQSPHHSCSYTGLIGGGHPIKPGEISLAHNGILLLDECGEFSRHSLNMLRQPIESKSITLSRANQTLTYPANFTLAATTNPCPCGYKNSPTHTCTCSHSAVDSYHKRLSGPLLDRIDMVLTINPIPAKDLVTPAEPSGESEIYRATVTRVRNIQKKRLGETALNAMIPSNLCDKLIPLNQACQTLMEHTITKLGLSGRAYFKLLKVARTIADIESAINVHEAHLLEALQYRLPLSLLD
jgi:magnesium chelatase family protein